MPGTLVEYLAQRSAASTFLLPTDLGRMLEELFPQGCPLPQPYSIHPADESLPPILGFPIVESHLFKDLEAKIDRWLADEIPWQMTKQPEAKEKAQLAFSSYLTQLGRIAENAMTSNLLADYHGVFWLAHSFDLARQFSSIPRRVSAVDVQLGRTHGEALKYRVFSRWTAETRELMNGVATRSSSILDGEEQQALQFFRLLQDDVLILTEEFIGPDLRELRSFVTGYLHRDFQSFRDSFERLRTTAFDVLNRDRMLKTLVPLLAPGSEQVLPVSLLFDQRMQNLLFEHPSVQNAVTREERDQFQLIARRVREFAVLNQLRRGIIWMHFTADGEVVSADRRNPTRYSRSTRPMDFERPGVVDPMVHRFGLIYDLSQFTETMGSIRRGGGKEEIRSYRQMLLFQRKLETVASRHLLHFEKFLGDGAFYTTRRASRLVRAAVEIQRFYDEMKRKGFAFNKGIRIAINHGYYRLLPLKVSPDADEAIMEFYGPGIVELSRLTTGKANKEIDEIAAFLIASGYEQTKVQQFFAPLSRRVDMIDPQQHAREHYAYVNANGHLINEGIVASFSLLQELSAELAAEGQQLHRLKAPWATYIGFAPAVSGFEFVGIRLLGMVSLKGLDDIEVGEVVPFGPGAVQALPVESSQTLVAQLRSDFHQDGRGAMDEKQLGETTTEHIASSEIVICISPEPFGLWDEVLIGEWDPVSDDVRRPLRMPRTDFQRLFALKGELSVDLLSAKKQSVRELYERLSDRAPEEPLQLTIYRHENRSEAYLLGEVVEKL